MRYHAASCGFMQWSTRHWVKSSRGQLITRQLHTWSTGHMACVL